EMGPWRVVSGSEGCSRCWVVAWARGVRRRYERELAALVELPSVSADPARAGDVRRTAAAAARLVRSLGGQASIIPTGGHPLVHCRFQRDQRAPTVTIYNHLDVQPAGEPEWRSEPFHFPPPCHPHPTPAPSPTPSPSPPLGPCARCRALHQYR